MTILTFWKIRFRDLKLAQKMIVIYIVLFGICLLISISALQISFRIYDGRLYEKSLQELDFFSQEVNRRVEDVENLSYNLALDPDIQDQLEKITTINYLSSEYSYEMYRFRMMLEKDISTNKWIKNIVYTDRKKTKFTVGTNTVEIPPDLYKMLLSQFHNAEGAYVKHLPSREYPYLLSGRDIRSYVGNVSLEYLGSLVFTSDIAGIIQNSVDTLEVQSASLCVYSDSGLIYENQDQMFKSLPDFKGTKGYQILKIRGVRYFLCYLKSSKNGMVYVNMFPYSEIFRQNQMVKYGCILGFFSLFLMAAAVVKKISHMLTKPLEHLTESMQIVETGDFQRARTGLTVEEGSDEIGQLSQEFDMMLQKIDNLIHENYKKQLLIRDTKLKMLQAQINPHFLYNTLNAIHWMIRVKRNDDAAKMIVVLGDTMRGAFSNKQYVTLREEIRLVENYITIQEFRYTKRAVFEISATGNLDEYQVPHMFIQPLVENAIYYGVENSLETCKVSVKVEEQEQDILIEVTDTGSGMAPEELEAVRNFTVMPKGNGIGLKNIYERLCIIYENPVFTIESEEGKGTAVTIRIPKMIPDAGGTEGDV